MKNNFPLVSITIPCGNEEKYIEKIKVKNY